MEQIQEYLKSPEGLNFLAELLRDNLTLSIDSDETWQCDRQYTTIEVSVEFNGTTIAKNSTTF